MQNADADVVTGNLQYVQQCTHCYKCGISYEINGAVGLGTDINQLVQMLTL